ncbi:MAG: GntR family transcriptional regulator [Deltaproteobacteria bacterium]|nr:GntR family transcriptional regulator [Deltaproteobacteria bacterium]
MKFEKISDFLLLKDKVYDAIKTRIIDLTLAPKEQLVEQRLAEELGVSKSPIREALLRLETDGLVYTLPFKGCFVAEITPQDLQHIFQLREALETYCLRLAGKNYSAENFSGIRSILSKGEAAVRGNHFEHCYSINTEFHDTLILTAKNPKIQRIYMTLRDHLDRYRNIASRIRGRVRKSHREHILIVEALEKRDLVQSEKYLSDHLRSVLDDLLRSKEFHALSH